MAFQYPPIALVFLVALTYRPVNGVVYYVASDVTTKCHSREPCYTLNYYANSTTLQLTDSVFHFMPGTHFLQQTWVINNGSNLTLTGEDVVVKCVNSTSDLRVGIRLINGGDINVSNMKILNCFDYVEILPSSLWCEAIHDLRFSNLTIEFSQGDGLHLKNCTDYVITNSVFVRNQGNGISVDHCFSGEVTSTKLSSNKIFGIFVNNPSKNPTVLQLNDVYISDNHDGIHVHADNMNIKLDRINATNNKNLDFGFWVCSVKISLSDSQSRGGFLAQQTCSFAQTFEVELQRCSFTDMGIGIVLVFSHAKNLNITISSCSLSNSLNDSVYPGIFLYSFLIKKLQIEHPIVAIKNVSMERISSDDNTFPAIFLYGIEQVEISSLSISNSKHGGLALYDSVALFRGTNIISNNSAMHGGGMALYGNSYMFMHPDSTLNFINNKAKHTGGAIFVSQEEVWISPGASVYEENIKTKYCFMQLFDMPPEINFLGNVAGYTGSNLYGGNIEECRQVHSQLELIDVLGLSTITTQCIPSIVSSDAKNLTFCDDNCTSINTTQTEKRVKYYPGAGQLHVPVAALGQLHGLTAAHIKLNYDEQVFRYDWSDLSATVNASCTTIKRALHAKRANTQGKIYLSVSNDLLSTSTQSPITLVVEILPCPAGFIFSDGACVCATPIQTLAKCDIRSHNITRFNTSWISPTNESIEIFEHCPFHYCNNDPFSVESPDDQCDNHRSGTLCGDCIQGYSLTFGSNECKNCTHQSWQLSVILLGSALAGFGLISVLIGLNLTVSVGTINGFLFFANVVKILEYFFLRKYVHEPVYTALHYCLSWLNLDLGITICFFEGMNACQKVWLQFAFPSYLLCLVLLIVALCRCGQWWMFRSLPWVVKMSEKITLLMGSKIIPVLATLLLLSYTKLVRTITLIYHKADIRVCEYNSTMSDCHSIATWYVNGNLEYLTGCHRGLFIFGTVIILPLITLFTAFLLFFPLMERHLPRLSCWSSWQMRLKPWYDAYGGPYKDQYRSWTGLLLLVRCILVLVVTIDSDQIFIADCLFWLCLILISLVAILQVYKSPILNVLEIAYISVLMAMVFFSTSEKKMQLYLVIIITLFLLIAILLFHVGQRLKCTRVELFLREQIMDKRKPSGSAELHPVEKFEDDDSKIVSMTSINIGSYNKLREPLLDFST